MEFWVPCFFETSPVAIEVQITGDLVGTNVNSHP